jgi:DNA-binding NarL/FixJ family response regulator
MTDQPRDDVITVALIEDNRLVREGITSLLNRYPDIRVVAGAPSGHEPLPPDANPRVILLDRLSRCGSGTGCRRRSLVWTGVYGTSGWAT